MAPESARQRGGPHPCSSSPGRSGDSNSAGLANHDDGQNRTARGGRFRWAPPHRLQLSQTWRASLKARRGVLIGDRSPGQHLRVGGRGQRIFRTGGAWARLGHVDINVLANLDSHHGSRKAKAGTTSAQPLTEASVYPIGIRRSQLSTPFNVVDGQAVWQDASPRDAASAATATGTGRLHHRALPACTFIDEMLRSRRACRALRRWRICSPGGRTGTSDVPRRLSGLGALHLTRSLVWKHFSAVPVASWPPRPPVRPDLIQFGRVTTPCRTRTCDLRA